VSEHTPGPWEYLGHARVQTADDKKTPIANFNFFAATEANARLIAAAPELLELLREAADYTRHPDYDWPVEFSRRVDAAIAKATGAPE
jgi:hypothetical protein